MPTNITDTSAFTDPIQGVADADAQAAASYNLGFQGLANRTRFLKDKGYTLSNITIFSADGTWTKPANCRAVRVTVVGGGGAGGGVLATSAGEGASSAGGGGGGTAIAWITTPGATEAVVVGAGGVGTTGTGGSGGASSFGAITAGGGGGGPLGTNDPSPRIVGGGVGGAVTTGDIRVRGGVGGRGVSLGGTANDGWGGDGGASTLGMPAQSAVGSSTANLYGSGGPGRRLNQSSSGNNGNDGARGVVIVEEYT